MSLGQMFASGLSAVWGGGSMFLMVVLAIILGTILKHEFGSNVCFRP